MLVYPAEEAIWPPRLHAAGGFPEEEARSMYTAHVVYWFFRRKARMVFLTACCYAALC